MNRLPPSPLPRLWLIVGVLAFGAVACAGEVDQTAGSGIPIQLEPVVEPTSPDSPTPSECMVSAECPDLYERACWEPLCAVGECRMAQLPLGRECDDGDATTGWDMCTSDGSCIGIPLADAKGEGGAGGYAR